jgi:hypothetical protein
VPYITSAHRAIAFTRKSTTIFKILSDMFRVMEYRLLILTGEIISFLAPESREQMPDFL